MGVNAIGEQHLRLTRHLLDSGVFHRSPLRIADVGVRGGPEARWNIYRDQIHLIGFDPDAEECERLQQSRDSSRSESYYPVALYSDRSTHTLYVADNLSASSLLRPNPDFVNRFPHAAPGAITGTVLIETTDLDSFAAEHHLDYIDFMKADVEGAELAVLDGAQRILSQSLLGLSLEVFFQPYHIGRPSFSDVDQYLRKRGFVFFDFLQREKWRRKTLATENPKSWYGSGQLIWAEALYFRDLPAEMLSPEFVPDASCRIKALKLASLAELFSCADFSAELLQNATKARVLDLDEVDYMVSLLTPVETIGGASANHRRRSRLGVVKQIGRKVLPASCRRELRHVLKAVLSS